MMTRIYCTEDGCTFEDVGYFASLPGFCPDCGFMHSVDFERPYRPGES